MGHVVSPAASTSKNALSLTRVGESATALGAILAEIRPWTLFETGSVASLVPVVRRRTLGKTSIVEHVSE